MYIYVKPEAKVEVRENTLVKIKDIAEIFAPPDVKNRVEDIILIKAEDRNNLINVKDIVKKIIKELPDAVVNCVGSADTLVIAVPEKSAKLVNFLKTALVCLVMFSGSATAIMSFHSDSQILEAFKTYARLFLGSEEKIFIVQLAYSVGLSVGIIGFFNHFVGRKITADPTPIEIEMNVYDKDVTDTLINTIKAAERKKKI